MERHDTDRGHQGARSAGGRDAGIEPVSSERVVEAPVEPGRPAERVYVALASGRGCLGLVVLGLTVGTAVWLWLRHEVVFPLELRSQVGFQVYAEFYRDLAIAAVVLVGLSWLWALRRRSDARMRSRAILATGLVTVSAVFLAWLWTQVRFEPDARDRQLKELATWAVALLNIASLYRLLRPVRAEAFRD